MRPTRILAPRKDLRGFRGEDFWLGEPSWLDGGLDAALRRDTLTIPDPQTKPVRLPGILHRILDSSREFDERWQATWQIYSDILSRAPEEMWLSREAERRRLTSTLEQLRSRSDFDWLNISRELDWLSVPSELLALKIRSELDYLECYARLYCWSDQDPPTPPEGLLDYYRLPTLNLLLEICARIVRLSIFLGMRPRRRRLAISRPNMPSRNLLARRRRSRGPTPYNARPVAHMTRGPNPLVDERKCPRAGKAPPDQGAPRMTPGSSSCPPLSGLYWSPALTA